MVHIINVSADRNNCGLFALALAIKLNLQNNNNIAPAIVSQFSFLRDISYNQLRYGLEGVNVVGTILRNEMHKALVSDHSYRVKRFESFIAYSIGTEAIPDMEAFVDANRAEIVNAQVSWEKIEAKLSQICLTSDFRLLDGYDVRPNVAVFFDRLVAQLTQTTVDNVDECIASLFSYYFMDVRHPVVRILMQKELFALAWERVTPAQATAQQRQLFNAQVAHYFTKQYFNQLKGDITEETTSNLENLFYFAVADTLNFSAKNNRPTTAAIMQSCKSLYFRYYLNTRWEAVYVRYCIYVRDNTVMLSADELSVLADYWHVQLVIHFPGRVYQTFSQQNAALLQVALNNPSQIHWQVSSDYQLPDETPAKQISSAQTTFTSTLPHNAVSEDTENKPTDNNVPKHTQAFKLRVGISTITELEATLKEMEEEKALLAKHYRIFKHYSLGSAEQNSSITLKLANGGNAHVGTLSALAYLGDNQLASVSTGDFGLKMWNFQTGSYISEKKVLAGPYCTHTFIDEETKHRKLVTASLPSNVELWDLTDNSYVLLPNLHTGPIRALQYLGSRLLASASDDMLIKFTDLNTKQQTLLPLSKHTLPIRALKLLKSGYLASASTDTKIYIWDYKKQAIVKALQGHTGPVIGLQELPDERLISCSEDKTIRIWDVMKEACLATLEGHNTALACLWVAPHNYLISGDTAGNLKIWDLTRHPADACIKTIQTGAALSSILLSDDTEGWILTGHTNGELKRWSIPDMALRRIEEKVPGCLLL